jgi:thermitase
MMRVTKQLVAEANPFRISSCFKLAALVGLSLVSLTGFAERNPDLHVVPGRILVRAKRNVNEDTLKATFGRINASQEGSIDQVNVRLLHVPKQNQDRVLQALRSNPNIEFAEPDYIIDPSATPNDPYFAQAWHLPMISAPTAWDYTVGSTAVTIAILDSGIDTTHPDLAGLLVGGWNFYDNNSNLADVSGHGTAVAGVAAALSNNGAGIAGVTWNCRVMPLRITDLNGYGLSSAIANALIWAADHGARVANISYGSVSTINTIVSAAQYFQSKGGVVTASAGNSGIVDSSADSPYFLLVSATDESDTICSWSNTGNNVDLAAPGQDIVTTVRGGGYGTWNGTSFSAPIVAGVAALVVSANPSLAGTKVQDILKQNADDLGTKGWDASYGWGRVNAAKAVSAAAGVQLGTPDTTAPTASVASPSAGATVTGVVSVNIVGTDNVAVTKVEWYLDGKLSGASSLSSATFPWNTTTVANGSHSMSAKAYDAAGNVGTSAAFIINVNNPVADTTAPTVTIGSPVISASLAGNISVTVSGADNVGVTKVEWYLDGALKGSSASAPAAFTWDTTTTPNGSHYLSAKAYDAAGNVGTSSSVGVNVSNPAADPIAPSATVSSPVLGAGVSGVCNVTISGSDNVGVTKMEWYLDNVLQGSNPGAVGNFSWNTTTAANGVHVVSAKAYDAAGNMGTSGPATVVVVNDSTPPTVVIPSPTAGSTLAGTVSVSVSSSDDVGVTKIEWYVDGALKGSTGGPTDIYPWDTTGVPNGSHTVSAKAYDAAGNIGNATPATVTVSNTVSDTAAPSAVISSPASGVTVSGVVNVAVSGSDNVGVTSLDLYIDDAVVTSFSGASGTFSWNTLELLNGTHTLYAVAQDAAANLGNSSTVTVTINNPVPDTIAPLVQITSPASGTKLAKNAKITVSASDNVAVTEIDLYIDGKLYQSATGSTATFSWNTAKLSAGSHTLQAFAFDAARNKGDSTIVTLTK